MSSRMACASRSAPGAPPRTSWARSAHRPSPSRSTADMPRRTALLPLSFFALEAKLIALGHLQRKTREDHVRLGDYCRERELAGDNANTVAAFYRKTSRRINAHHKQ